MKTILLIRHAHSTWKNIEEGDFARPLSKHGRADALDMALRLKNKKIPVDACFTSPAARALSTCRYFAEEYHLSNQNINSVDSLYDPPLNAFFNVITEANDAFDNIAIFSHNPGITVFANLLTSTKIDNMPACGIFSVRFSAEKWKEFDVNLVAFSFFEYPNVR